MKLGRHIVAALSVLLPMSAAAMPDSMHGYWLTENGKAIVLFEPCGSTTCGKMVWIDDPNDETGKPKLDVNNPDVEARDRTLCGLTLVGDLNTEGSAKDGWIYNPRDGETYSVAVEPISGEKLEVRGYLGVPLLGSSQVWTRVSGDRGGCGA